MFLIRSMSRKLGYAQNPLESWGSGRYYPQEAGRGGMQLPDSYLLRHQKMGLTICTRKSMRDNAYEIDTLVWGRVGPDPWLQPKAV